MKNILMLGFMFLITGCTAVQYNGTETVIQEVDYPVVGKQITAYVGDHMVQKGIITEEGVLVVHKSIDGALYDIPAKKYSQIGFDNEQYFYSPIGVIKSAFSDPVQALSYKNK